VRVDNTFVLSVEGAFDALPKHGTLHAGYLLGVLDLVRSRGLDPLRVLERCELESTTFDDPDQHIECGAAVKLLESCSSLCHDPLFGMRLAERQHPEAFGCAVTLARAAPTLREALESLVDYVPVTASPEGAMELAVGREMTELRWSTDVGFGDFEQTNYHGLCLITKTVQTLIGASFRPSYATLTFKVARAQLQTLQTRLCCAVRGGSDAHAIAFPTTLLESPVVTANRAVYSLLGDYLRQLRAASRSGFVEQIEAYVRRALPTGNCLVDGCAAKLGVSSRTLQKRLTRTNLKFSTIVQQERVKLAKHALLHSDRSLDEIALQLGYSEQTSFGRAFKRSTGVTPQAFRSMDEHRALS
jgi:AraC-like DNA-binding protein